MAENGIAYNFIDPAITNAGGFSVELNVQSINSGNTDPNNRYVGFGVGLIQAQAAGGNDISKSGSFRGEVGNPGVAACFVDLNLSGNIDVWTNGFLYSSTPVGASSGVLVASYRCTDFTTTNPVTLNVFFNGRLVNISPAGINSNGVTFYWNQNNANYIGLSARATSFAQIDNLAIRTLPLVNSLVTDYAMSFGLTGVNTAPNADPDGDRVSNFGEWAFGGNPTIPDANVGGINGVRILPGNDFRFEFQRYINSASTGLQYQYLISSDLVHWTAVAPTELSASVNEDNADYEIVTMELPKPITAGMPNCFLRILASSN